MHIIMEGFSAVSEKNNPTPRKLIVEMTESEWYALSRLCPLREDESGRERTLLREEDIRHAAIIIQNIKSLEASIARLLHQENRVK